VSLPSGPVTVSFALVAPMISRCPAPAGQGVVSARPSKVGSDIDPGRPRRTTDRVSRP